ncbi:MAG: serine protease, partial [Oscillospiraceae bacterium]|nr:serine protease [Oscillospiraceae bacterium]
AVHEGVFTDIRKEKQAVDFMYSEENIYLDDGKAIGFVKPYIGGYSFVALLPKENVGINKYIESLTGERFLNILKKAKSATVIASVPKFEYTYDVSMGSVLKTLGMPDAFDANKADFSRMGTSSGGPLCISEVLHKTYIAVDERGTKAGAATAVIMAEGASPQEKIKYIDLDRPFVFAIIDNATNLPVFLGTLMTV